MLIYTLMLNIYTEVEFAHKCCMYTYIYTDIMCQYTHTDVTNADVHTDVEYVHRS